MPIYDIQVPDGRILSIEGPENASEDRLIQAAQEYVQSNPIEQQPVQEQPDLGDKIIGAAETAATLATGATGGTVGTISGTVRGIADEVLSGEFGTPEAAERISQKAAADAQYWTYQPQTESGQEMVQGVAETLTPLQALAPMSAQMAPLRQAVRQTAPLVPGAVQGVAGAVRQSTPVQAAQRGMQNVRQRISNRGQNQNQQDRSVGAAQTNREALVQADVEELGLNTQLTKGQITGRMEDRQFENAMARSGEGKEIRDRFQEQNLAITQKLESWVDDTGATLTELRDVGSVVDDVLTKRAAKDKARIKSLYSEARRKGEMNEEVPLSELGLYLEQNRAAQGTAPIIAATRGEMERLGGIVKDGNGNYIIKPMSLNDAEQLRKFINKNTNQSDSVSMNYSKELKKALDKSTEGRGGDIYKKARKARQNYAEKYENAVLIDQLLGTKGKSTDRAIALENIVDKVVLSPSTSLDQMRQVRRLLQTKTGGKEGPGAQAWKEVQGAVLRDIKDKMLKSMQRDENNNPIVSPAQLDRAIKQLDKSGKLTYLFDKKGAERLRLLNEITQRIMISPPGAVNHSNTATVLAGLMDVAISGSTGIPAPIASGLNLLKNQIKDRRLKKKIDEHLNYRSGDD